MLSVFWWCMMHVYHTWAYLQRHKNIKRKTFLVRVLSITLNLDSWLHTRWTSVLTASEHLPYHRVLPTLSNATYGKRVEKGDEIAAFVGIGALVLSLLQIRAIYCLYFDYFSNCGSQLELVAAFGGLASHSHWAKLLLKWLNHTWYFLVLVVTSNPRLQVLKCTPPRRAPSLMQRSAKHWLASHLSENTWDCLDFGRPPLYT